MILLPQLSIKRILGDAGIIDDSVVVLADTEYVVPDRGWFFGTFARYLGERLATETLRYDSEAWDCDDFTAYARVLAGVCNARTLNHPKAALAVSEFWYSSVAGGHAIVCAVVHDGDTWQPCSLAFMEPQTQEEVKLKPEEIRSCSFVRF